MGWCRRGRLLGGSTVGITWRDKENRWHWPGCSECSLVFCCIVQTESGLSSGTDKFQLESKQQDDLTFKWTNQLSLQVYIAVESAGKKFKQWEASPNLEELCDMWTDDVNRAGKLPDYWTVNREDLGTRLTCFGSDYKTAEYFTRFTSEELSELLAKNIARTARRQLDGQHLLFGEYLQNWTTLYLLNLPINIQLNIHYRRWT